MRRKSRTEIGLEDVREPSTAPAAGDPLLTERLNRLVASLPEKLRATVVLRYQEDLDPEEIARVLDVPLRTVRDHLQKGLALLRQKAAHYLGEV